MGSLCREKFQRCRNQRRAVPIPETGPVQGESLFEKSPNSEIIVRVLGAVVGARTLTSVKWDERGVERAPQKTKSSVLIHENRRNPVKQSRVPVEIEAAVHRRKWRRPTNWT